MSVPADSIAAREAALAREVLDRVTLELVTLPQSPDGAAVTAFARDAQRALAAVSDRGAGADEHLARLDRAERALAHLIAALGRATFGRAGADLAAALETARRALAEARAPTIEQLAAQPWRATLGEAPTEDRWVASEGIPRRFVAAAPAAAFHTPAAAPTFVAPTIDVDALFAELRRLDEDDLEARVAQAAEPTEPVDRPALVLLRPPRPTEDIDVPGRAGELAQLRRIARDCLESVGVIGHLRLLDGDDRWGEASQGFEARLLAKLDALMALGVGDPAIAPLEEALRHAADGPPGDVFRAYARALVLACSGGAAAHDAVVAMRASEPSTFDAQADALALASGDAVDGALRSAVREGGDPTLLTGLLRAIHRRGARAPGEAIPLLQHPDDGVRAAAVRLIEDRDRIDRALDDPAEEVALAALEVLLIIDRRAARERLRATLSAEVARPGHVARATRGELALLLAIGGEGRDAELLQSALDDQPATLTALGWHGHPSHVEPLIARLGGGTRAIAAAQALHRITGAEVGDGEDGYAPSTSADRWRAYWAERAASAGTARLRLGQPFSLRIVADELGRFGVPFRDRAILAREIALAGAPQRIDVRGWVAAQRASLAALEEASGGRSRRFLDAVAPGSWLGQAAI